MYESKKTGYPSVDKPWLKYFTQEAIDATLPSRTVYENLWETNKEYLNQTALNYFDRKIPFSELFDNIEKTAKAFAAIGVKNGDIVAITTVTTPETIYIFYALNRIGAVANMIDPRTSVEGIKDYINETKAKFIVTIDVAYPKIEKAIVGTPVEKIVVVSPSDSLPQPKKALFNLSNAIKRTTPKLAENCLRWGQFITNGANTEPNYIPYKKDTCCLIVHTGGTTGSPKGVMLSNDSVNSAGEQVRYSPHWMRRNDIFLDIMPPFIAYGIVLGIHMGLSLGWQLVVIPQFDPNSFDKLLLKYHPGGMMGVPAYFEKIIGSPLLENKDLSFLRALLVGGDKTAPDLEVQVNEYLKAHNSNIHLSKGYSMTEASSAATLSYEIANKIGSNGIPLNKTVVAAFDPDTGEECKYGQAGEICICTPTMMIGYYGKEADTADIIKTHADGLKWVHTGDLGYVDEDGFVFVQGRLKRMIIRHDGFKVFPPLIEKVIAKDTRVAESCVVGTSDKNHRQGKLPVAYIVLHSGNQDKQTEIRSNLTKLCHDGLPEYAQPIAFVFQDALPLTPIGKVDYRALENAAEDLSVN